MSYLPVGESTGFKIYAAQVNHLPEAIEKARADHDLNARIVVVSGKLFKHTSFEGSTPRVTYTSQRNSPGDPPYQFFAVTKS